MLIIMIESFSMRRIHTILIAFLVVPLSACSSGNIKSALDYNAPAAPLMLHPYYNPYAPYGEANATWTAPVWERNGTIVKPADPGVEAGRPPYESAPWATGASGGGALTPPGTF